jgi:hypothetical protein
LDVLLSSSSSAVSDPGDIMIFDKSSNNCTLL